MGAGDARFLKKKVSGMLGFSPIVGRARMLLTNWWAARSGSSETTGDFFCGRQNP